MKNHNSGSTQVVPVDIKRTNDSQKQHVVEHDNHFEIERSLYYLGRALYRYSLLKKERSENGDS